MLRARPPAKLNLTLAVEPGSEDGYHPLRSVFVRLALADDLAVDFAPPGASADQLTVDGEFEVPVEGNLVLRAFSLLRAQVGQALPPLSARLTKRIPVGAGLAGGSSDGAAALELAARAWGVGLAPAAIEGVAAELGSDVPFFIRGGPAALVSGRGEVVDPLPGLMAPVGVLLSLGPEPLSTARVFGRFDERGDAQQAGALAATEELVLALRGGLDGAGLTASASRLREANELWPAATDLAPELVQRRAGLERLTGRPWLLSGSGPTLFALYATPPEAATERARLASGGTGRLIATASG